MIEETGNGRQSKIVSGLEVFGNIFFLNVLFVVFSLPIITMGASFTALFSVSIKMTKHEEGTIYHSFVAAFKENFKKSTIVWILTALAGVILWGELVMVMNLNNIMAYVYMFVMVIEAILILLTVPFVFPLIARYDNTLINTIKNAFLLAVSNLWSWIKFTLIWFMPIFISLYYAIIFLSTWFIWLIFGFGLQGYCSAIVIRKVFEKVERVQKEDKEEKEEDKKIKEEVIQERKTKIRDKMKRFENKADDEE